MNRNRARSANSKRSDVNETPFLAADQFGRAFHSAASVSERLCVVLQYLTAEPSAFNDAIVNAACLEWFPSMTEPPEPSEDRQAVFGALDRAWEADASRRVFFGELLTLLKPRDDARANQLLGDAVTLMMLKKIHPRLPLKVAAAKVGQRDYGKKQTDSATIPRPQFRQVPQT